MVSTEFGRTRNGSYLTGDRKGPSGKLVSPVGEAMMSGAKGKVVEQEITSCNIRTTHNYKFLKFLNVQFQLRYRSSTTVPANVKLLFKI